MRRNRAKISAHSRLISSGLVYDELLASQLALALIRDRLKRGASVHPFTPGVLSARAEAALPFTLTEGQRRVMEEVRADFASGQRMLRLLQGDVGSGKTAVALLAMTGAVEAGFQAALMVPTEILGRQHLAFIRPILAQIGIEAVMLSGSTEPAERQRILAGLAEGKIPIVIGTHALFQESVTFKNLGLAVIDEQHRFGVNQRLALAEKGRGTHILLMTATPIPRSLTLTLFGDMDVSLLTEKPKGRQPIATRVVSLARQKEMLQALARALDAGEKVYWICPLVEEATAPMRDSHPSKCEAAQPEGGAQAMGAKPPQKQRKTLQPPSCATVSSRRGLGRAWGWPMAG